MVRSGSNGSDCRRALRDSGVNTAHSRVYIRGLKTDRIYLQRRLFAGDTMMSVSRDAKKTNNFSIEAIMARGCTTSRACACPAGPPQPPVKPPQGHPTRIGHPAACFPSHVDYARLAVARTTGIPGGPWGVGGGPVYAAAPAPPPFPADSLQAFQCQLYASAVAQHKHSTPFYNWLLARQGDYFGRALQGG